MWDVVMGHSDTGRARRSVTNCFRTRGWKRALTSAVYAAGNVQRFLVYVGAMNFGAIDDGNEYEVVIQTRMRSEK